MQDRHSLNFAAHEEGRVTFREYLNRVVFYKKRSFTSEAFRLFIEYISEKLNRTLHRIRQESIDEELFDVVSGFEALTAREAKPKTR